jgi:hypothetical protein
MPVPRGGQLHQDAAMREWEQVVEVIEFQPGRVFGVKVIEATATGGRGMTKAIVAVLAAAAALPAAAHAGARADYQQTFTTPVPGASTGMDAQILYKHPDDPNAKPIPVRQEVFTFPKGTEFDNDVVPDCEATELELQIQGEAACPPESRVGEGEGTLMTGFGGENAMEVDIFDAGDGVLILGGSKDPEIRSATHARRDGRVTTVDVPRSPGGPPDGESAIRRVHNVISAFSAGDRAYMRTPPVCPRSGVWTFHAKLTFADGAVEENTHEMPCERSDDAKPRIRIGGIPRTRCVQSGFGAHVRVVDASPLDRVRLRLDGRLLHTTTAATFTKNIPARGLDAGRHRLAVDARDAAGNRARRAVRFRRC